MNILCALLYILVNSYTLSHSLASKVDSNQTNIRCSSGSEDVKGIMTFINMPLHTSSYVIYNLYLRKSVLI